MVTKRLIVMRHGNTFLPDQKPTRVGRRTDLPLVEEHRGRAIGKYLLAKGLSPDKAYAAPLKRTMQTLQLALDEMELNLDIIPEESFLEIDYGVDENKTEDEVLARLGRRYMFMDNDIVCDSKVELLECGKAILNLWDRSAVVPFGWTVDVQSIINSWHSFAAAIEDNTTSIICTSNGIIRFAPYILGAEGYENFCNSHEIKVATGSISIFDFENDKWRCSEWNVKPYKIF